MRWILILLGICHAAYLCGQNDGIRGYGNLEFLSLDTYGGQEYTNGGGGVIVNNNLVLGVYVSALTKPYRWDFFTELSSGDPEATRLTNNEVATNSTITNFDVGGRIGFNIAPAKSFQGMISLNFGYATINYLESYIDESVDLDDPDLEVLPVRSFALNHNDLSFSPQLDLQFKIGRSFKISVIAGHKFQKTRLRAPGLFPQYNNLLTDPKLFGGTYAGLGFYFGNL